METKLENLFKHYLLIESIATVNNISGDKVFRALGLAFEAIIQKEACPIPPATDYGICFYIMEFLKIAISEPQVFESCFIPTDADLKDMLCAGIPENEIDNKVRSLIQWARDNEVGLKFLPILGKLAHANPHV